MLVSSKALWALGFGIVASFASAVSGFEVVEVEETWAVVVGEPDASKNSPQISTTMGPLNTTSGLHFLFTVNHLSEPNYVPGGMQLQVWNNEALVSQKTSPVVNGLLSHNNETVRWTQKLSVQNGALTIEIVDGTSTTWGNFGGQGHLKHSVASTAPNLNQYRPHLSLTESGVGYGGNRVKSFELERVRWKLSTGQTFQFLAPIDIDADLDP